MKPPEWPSVTIRSPIGSRERELSAFPAENIYYSFNAQQMHNRSTVNERISIQIQICTQKYKTHKSESINHRIKIRVLKFTAVL